MRFETILLDIAAGVARITLNRPARLNSFTVQMHGELAQALTMVEGEPAVRTLLLTGAGRGFCAGQDLNDRAVAPGDEVDLGHSVETYYNPLVRRLVALPMPVVCAVNGVAAGAGASLALAADIVVAAQSASFVLSFARIGLVPDTGGTWVLPRLVGQARALGMALTGATISAAQAEDWGLIWQVVADGELAAVADGLLEGFARAPTAGLVATKRMIRASWLHSLDQELDLQRDAMRQLGRSADYREGVAAFLARRPPQFQGR